MGITFERIEGENAEAVLDEVLEEVIQHHMSQDPHIQQEDDVRYQIFNDTVE